MSRDTAALNYMFLVANARSLSTPSGFQRAGEPRNMLDTETARLVEVPLDEGVIDRSLAELDVKLAVWIDAASKFQENLATRAETAQRSEQHDDSKTEGQAAPHGAAPTAGGEGGTSACQEAHAQPSGNTRVDEEAGVLDDSSDPSRLRVFFEKRQEPVRHEVEQVDDAIHEAESETEDQLEPQPSLSAKSDSNGAEGSDSASPTAEEEENVLLASLDPETRRHIHVLRRVSGERQSIHRLLQEYRATQARQSEPGKRSWWRLSR